MYYNLLPIETAIEEHQSISGRKEHVSDDLVLKIANDVVSSLPKQDISKHKLKLLYIKDYDVIFPDDFQRVVQVAYRRRNEKKKVTRQDLVEWAYKNYDGSGCDVNVSVDCDDCGDSPEVIIDADRIEELNHPEYFYAHMPHFYRYGGLGKNNQALSGYNDSFKLLKPAQNNFFNSEYHIPGCLNLNRQLTSKCEAEYKISMPKLITNIKECEVLLSYLGAAVDENGYRKIPDNRYVYEAITWKVEQILHYHKFNQTGNTKFENASERAYQKYLRAYKAAWELLDNMDYDTWESFMKNHWVRPIPYYNSRDNYDRNAGDIYDVPRI